MDDVLDSFFDVFENITIPVQEALMEKMENLSDLLDNNLEDLDEIESMLEAVGKLDGMADDLENLGRDVRSQNDEVENNGEDLRLYVIVLAIVFSVWSLIILMFLFGRTRRRDEFME